MTEERRVTRAAGIIGLATLLSRITGFVRDVIVAGAFGAGLAADAFYVAYRIPNMLRELFAEGSMSSGFIPVFTEYLTKRSKTEARELASAAFTALLLILIGVCALGIYFAPVVVKMIAPGFAGTAEKIGLTIRLTRIMFPYLFFIGLAAIAMGILNSLRSFGVPALSPVMLNVCMVSSVFFLCPFLDQPIVGLAVGALAGGACQWLIQLPQLYRKGFSLGWRFDPSHPGVRRIGWLVLPAMLGQSVAQINILVNNLLASYLPQGSITYLFYGLRLIYFPLGIFGVALATAIMPTLSAQAVEGRLDRMRETFSFGLRLVFFIVFPAMVGLIVLRVPIVEILYQHGRFTAADTQGTATAVLFYAVGLIGFASVRIVVPFFYALQDTRTPVKVAVITLVLNIVLNLALMGPLRHGGLALATSISSTMNFLTLAWILRGRIGRIDGRRILRSYGRVFVASVGMAVICGLVAALPLWGVSGSLIWKIVWLGIAITGSSLFYLGVHIWFGSEEWLFIRNLAGEKLARKE